MRVQFIGVGEAFDETQANNSQLLEWPGCRLLIDCGYAVPHALWRLHPDPELLDAIYLSHRHADHYFGLPSYFVRLMEDGRTRDIDVICSEGMATVIREMLDYAYQNVMSHAQFGVHYIEVLAGEPLEYRNAKLEFAASSHPVRNYAIAVSVEESRYAYSGDGNFTPQTRELYHGCSLLVHEAYSFEAAVKGHACIKDVIQMAKDENVQKLALTHLNRDLRKLHRAQIEEYIRESGMLAFIPDAAATFEV